jgi:hypothetical protein
MCGYQKLDSSISTDTSFAVAMAAGIGICAANLAFQVHKEHGALAAAIAREQDDTAASIWRQFPSLK